AVKAGRIAAVGTDDDVRPLIGPRTRVVNLDGRMLLPGFQDAHVHAPSGGLDRLRIDLSEAHSLDGYRERIRAYVEAHAGEGWVLGGGWAMDVFPGGTPHREELDALVPDRPVFINNRDNHGAWVSSKALELAGITAKTADPADGRIERDERGAPSGTLHEGAMDLVRRHVPPTAAPERLRGLLEAQAYLHSLGITAWQDAIVGDYSTIQDNYDVYVDASERGELTARVVGALWYARGRGLDQIPSLVERRGTARNGRFRATSVKIMSDGVCENFTAAMLDPFLGPDGRPTDNTGISFFEADELREAVVRLDAEGFQVHVHVIGDRACRTALDAFEAARSANGPNDLRHHLAHIQVVHPDDVPRFRELGVTANAQPLWAAHEPQMDDLTIPYLGEPRASWQYPFASLVRSGATLAFGSDWPVSSPNPLWETHVAVNRVEPEAYPYADASHRTEPFLPGERLDLPTALAAFTIGSAYVNHLDGETGSIEPGKLADLVVVDRNLFEHPAEEIAEARVLLTLVEGEPVFEDASV
ncbi:MAG TPA: amidohydrolase family protein, partial [Actinomycetota bacterium]|nr:amidohydrolase family protein [Actinomycetota bacterium]